MARFKKGEGGRPKGTPNKITADLRDWLSNFIDENKNQILHDWKALEAKDRIAYFEKLLKYVLPTLQATTVTTEYDRLTDDQLDQIIYELKNNIDYVEE